MTRPSNFILNSDYLALAQYDKNSAFVTVPSGSISGYSAYYITRDFTVPSSSNSLDRFYVSLDQNTWRLGHYTRDINANLSEVILVSRTGKNKITVAVVLLGMPNESWSAHNIYVRVCSFKPPNIL